MTINNLEELYVAQLRQLYSAEGQLIRALPRSVVAAKSPKLRALIESVLTQTQAHLERLDEIFEQLAADPHDKPSRAVAALLLELDELIAGELTGPVLDAALMGACQRVEHFEIAAYSMARTYASILGYTEAAELLEQTYREEVEADDRLRKLAEEEISAETEPATPKRQGRASGTRAISSL